MKYLNYFILIALLITSCSDNLTYQQKLQRYNRYIFEVDSLIQNEDYIRAVAYSDLALELTDTIASAHFLKGIATYNLGLFDDSEDCFTEVIEIEGASSIAYKNRSKVYLKTNNDDFLEDIEKYLKYHSNDEEAHILKRDFLEKEGEFEGAIEEYNEALQKNENDIELLAKRADLHLKNGSVKKSIEDYEKILQIQPDQENISKRIAELKLIQSKTKKRNIVLIVLIALFLIYTYISKTVLKPIVERKAINEIGGKIEIANDPLIWILPLIIIAVYLLMNFLI